MNTPEAHQFAQENPELAQEAREQIQAVLARSATDWTFRQKLLRDPREAIAEHTGRNVADVPESIDLIFVENEADATVVMPDPVDSEGSLSDEELEAVAGGESPVLLIGGAIVAGASLGLAAHTFTCDEQ